MKKVLLVLAASIAVSSTYAQRSSADSLEVSSLKPISKNWATELNVNPFKGELSLNNSLNQIKIRKFTSENFALRFGVNATRLGSEVENSNPYGTNPSIYKQERSSTVLGINFGIEKHFKGTKRLSPYIGADIALANKWSKQETTNGQTTTTIDGAWINTTYMPISVYNPYIPSGQLVSYQTVSQPQEQAYSQYGLNLLTGFDFYISRHFFFGYEFNFGFNQTKYKDIEYSQTGTTNNNANNTQTKNNVFNVGTSLLNGIRLGYVL